MKRSLSLIILFSIVGSVNAQVSVASCLATVKAAAVSTGNKVVTASKQAATTTQDAVGKASVITKQAMVDANEALKCDVLDKDGNVVRRYDRVKVAAAAVVLVAVAEIAYETYKWATKKAKTDDEEESLV